MLAGLHRIGFRTSTITNVSFVCLTNSLRRPAVMAAQTNRTQKRPSSDMALFREKFGRARAVAILTGAGISAESGIPTFRGEGGFWRTYSATDLATPDAFRQNPALVWEFYHYRRELVRTKQPNKAHYAIADCERRFARQGRRVTVITQNIDGLHYVAGSRNVIPLHGDLFTTRCLKCKDVDKNMDSPICPALKGKGLPEPEVLDAVIPEKDLPRCKKNGCGGLLRPDVIWFGENLDRTVLENAEHALQQCDLCLVIGTSSVVYPAAMFAPEVARRGIPVAEFNTEETPATLEFGFHFKGPAGDTVPQALALHPDEPVYDD